MPPELPAVPAYLQQVKYGTWTVQWSEAVPCRMAYGSTLTPGRRRPSPRGKAAATMGPLDRRHIHVLENRDVTDSQIDEAVLQLRG